MAKKQITWPKRGEIFYVNFDPTIGTEIKKTRPALILQNDIGNQFASTTIVAAITSRTKKVSPFTVLLKVGQGGLSKTSLVLLNQIRTIDKRRLQKRLGHLGAKTMKKVDKAFKVSLGL